MAELIYRTLRENIADIIQKRIIYQELEPGQKIVEQDLAKEFKTSRLRFVRHLDSWKMKDL